MFVPNWGKDPPNRGGEGAPSHDLREWEAGKKERG